MYAVTRLIRLLVVVAVINYASCQEGFSEQDLLRLQQLSANDGQVETITSFNNNVVQRDPIRNDHSINAVGAQYHFTDDVEKNNDYGSRANQGRSDRRKVFRIKNPFQRQLDSNERPEDENNTPQDSNSGASNQYASMQYSLPPEEFLQKMRAENQYLQQISTPNPLISYTATPQSQYQYATNSQPNYENIQQSHQINQLESKISQSLNNGVQYQYGSYSFDNAQSTPSPIPPYLSTVDNQFVGTPTNSYVSSASPAFLSSQPNLQQYVSSPGSIIQTVSPDYSNRVSTVSANTINYDPNDQNKRIQIDHYDNSANGIRYPINIQQYSNDFPSSTPATPNSSPYPDPIHDSWQNAINAGALSKSMQEFSMSNYQNSQYNNNNPQESRSDSSLENQNTDTHRLGNMPAANNMYLDYVQPDYQSYKNIRSSSRDLEQDASQSALYSNGDYGWKMHEKKASGGNDAYVSSNTPTRYQTYGLHDGSAISQMNFYLDSGKSQNYGQVSKSAIESQEVQAQEFAKAAAKAHENMKHQQLAKLTESYFGHQQYIPSFNPNNVHANSQAQSNVVSTFYGNSDRQNNKLFADSSNVNPLIYGNSQQQQDLITATPYYYGTPKEAVLEGKPKQPFDHAKALKNIVSIDVSNVIGNSEEGAKGLSGSDNNVNRFNIPNFTKEQFEQNIKQYYKPVTDSYYRDKNSGYGFNIKSKPDEILNTDNLKQLEQNIPYYGKQTAQEPSYSHSLLQDNKRYSESTGPQINYLSQASNNYPSSVQPSSGGQQNLQRPQSQVQSDITSILKLNDIPYRLTQGLNSDALRLHNNNFDQNGVPTPIPSRINQNVGSHQLDVTNSILNKLLVNKQLGGNNNRPELDLQSGGSLSTINGFRVANPFNVDLKLVADMLKGKSPVDESHMISLRDQFNKPSPLKLDMSSLQQLLLKNDNYGNLAAVSDGLGAIGNPYLDIYNSRRYPYQGVKYSRSQEEEENIPIADASNTHAIGAVIEQDEAPDAREVNEETDITESESIPDPFEVNGPKVVFSRDHKDSDRHRHPNLLFSGRHTYPRKYPKTDVAEPYPLLKPPPHSHSSRSRFSQPKRSRRRRVNRPKYGKILKTEPLFEAQSSLIEETVEKSVPTLLRPPRPVPEAKSDIAEEKTRS